MQDVPFIVVDASVAITWLLPEQTHRKALDLLRSHALGAMQLIAPSVLMEEAGSAISKEVRRNRLSAAQGAEAFELLHRFRPLLLDSPELLRGALALSLRNHLSFWNCVYLALAMRFRCELVTADRRFHRAASRIYSSVVLLSAGS